MARRLLTLAVRCFAASGYHGTTTRDSSSAVSLNPDALYRHFPSKELVLFEIARTSHQQGLACTADVRHRTDDAFRHTVARGVADKTFSPVDVHRAVRAMLSSSMDLVRRYRLDGHDSPEKLGQFYADLALWGHRVIPRQDALENRYSGQLSPSWQARPVRTQGSGLNSIVGGNGVDQLSPVVRGLFGLGVR